MSDDINDEAVRDVCEERDHLVALITLKDEALKIAKEALESLRKTAYVMPRNIATIDTALAAINKVIP